MRLLINLCAHDGIISHYTGVGTMVKRYIKVFAKIFREKNISYDLKLYTPEYAENSFGYDKKTHLSHEKYRIIQVSNGSNKKANYGTPQNWEELSQNTAKIINMEDYTKYDLVLTIYNDTPFAKLGNYLKQTPNHKMVWIPHSTVKIHLVDSAVEGSENFFADRLKWEMDAIYFINNNANAYVGTIGKFIKNHLINEYNLDEKKALSIINGELLSEKEDAIPSTDVLESLYTKIKDLDTILLSFARAEEYKNLVATMHLGHYMKLPAVVIAQSYYKEQDILKEYTSLAQKLGTYLYIDPPFSFAKYILQEFKGKIILVVPSEKETMGLIINEIRKLKKNNILLVANNIDGLKEQITSGIDGLLVPINDYETSGKIIRENSNEEKMTLLSTKGYEKLREDYDLEKNVASFLKLVMGE